MAVSYCAALRNARMDAIKTKIDVSPPGKVRFYSGSRPANPDTAPGGGNTLLAEATLSNPCAPAASGGVLTFSSVTRDNSADASGTAAWFRIVDGAGAGIVDGTVGTSGADCIVPTTTVVATQPFEVASIVLTEGNP